MIHLEQNVAMLPNIAKNASIDMQIYLWFISGRNWVKNTMGTKDITRQ